MSLVVPHIVRVPEEPAWRVRDGDDTVGFARALVRPDGRCFVFFRSCRADAYEPLLAGIGEHLDRDLYVMVDETDDEGLRRFELLGFVVDRRESDYRIPTDPDVTGTRAVELSVGFVTISPAEADEDRLRVLEDTLRQDVAGVRRAPRPGYG